MDASIEQRLSVLEERLAIRDVYDRYNDTFNNQDWDGYKSCFTADAVWEATEPFNISIAGPQALVDLIKSGLAELDFVVQWNSGHCIQIDGDTAIGRVGLSELGHGSKSSLRSTGIYFDELVKLDGEWKFSKRHFVCKYFDTTHRSGNSHAGK